MRCKNTDDATLVEFMDLPVSPRVINKALESVEAIMRPIQIEKKKESEINALDDEIKVHRDNYDLMEHTCHI